jgi:hypothetical protein
MRARVSESSAGPTALGASPCGRPVALPGALPIAAPIFTNERRDGSDKIGARPPITRPACPLASGRERTRDGCRRRPRLVAARSSGCGFLTSLISAASYPRGPAGLLFLAELVRAPTTTTTTTTAARLQQRPPAWRLARPAQRWIDCCGLDAGPREIMSSAAGHHSSVHLRPARIHIHHQRTLDTRRGFIINADFGRRRVKVEPPGQDSAERSCFNFSPKARRRKQTNGQDDDRPHRAGPDLRPQ